MSHGIGVLQRKILEAVAVRWGQVHAIDLAWRLFSDDGQARPTRAFRENVRRAATRLVELGRLSATKVRLGGYPGLIYYLPEDVVLQSKVNPSTLFHPDSCVEMNRARGQGFEYNTVNKSFLSQRGWTRTAIKRFLGEPDSRIVMASYRRDRQECRYDMQRVLKAENEVGFRFRKRPVRRVVPTMTSPGNRNFHWEDGIITPNDLTLKQRRRLAKRANDDNT